MTARDELARAKRAVETYGQVIEKQCRDVLDVTGLHHLINEDGDGHWDVVWMRLFEMRDELASLKESTIARERQRGDSWRQGDEMKALELTVYPRRGRETYVLPHPAHCLGASAVDRLSQQKRLTDAELAAEYWRLRLKVCASGNRDMKAKGHFCIEWQAAHDELDTMQRFLELPHYDESQP
jgi:hypothetical protein